MTKVRNILLVGRTGSGKSTLANVLTNTNKFKESNYAVSETREIKTEEFKDEEKDIKYRIIDTVGIGDTRMSLLEDLYDLVKLSEVVKDGLSQIFFVTSGELSEESKLTYVFLKEVIFDKNIIDYTTVVKTRFDNFRNKGKCEEDKNRMLKNEKLREMIGGNKEKIIHVNNPSSIDVIGEEDEEEQNALNKKKRERSRRKLLEYLEKMCKDFYKPENLERLNKRINNAKSKLPLEREKEAVVKEFIKFINEKKLNLSEKELSKLNKLNNKLTESDGWPKTIKSWINASLNVRGKGCQSDSDLNLEQLREEDAAVYPLESRKEITELNIHKKNFHQGDLDLSDFVNLEELNCSSNKLTGLNLASPNQIQRINVSNNYLQDLNFLSALSSETTRTLNINNNDFHEQGLSIFSRFTNLEGLFIGDHIGDHNFFGLDAKEKISKGICSRFVGSLEPLKNLSKLKTLDIGNTDIDSGLEYLPESVEKFWCSADKRPKAKCQALYNLFADEQGTVETEEDKCGLKYIKNFPQKLQTYKQKIQVKPEIEKELVSNNIISEQLNEQLAKNNYLTEFANIWQKYLDTAQTPEGLTIRKDNILAAINVLKTEQQSQILHNPPKTP